MARSTADIEAEIAETRAALTKALQAQSYGLNGRNLSRAAVGNLQARLDVLYRQLSRATHGAVRRCVVKDVGGAY